MLVKEVVSMLGTAILFGFGIITQTSCKIILPPIPKLYGTSNCQPNFNPGFGIQSQTIVTPPTNPDINKQVYNVEKPTFPALSQAPISVLGVQTRTLIAPYQNSIQNTGYLRIENEPVIAPTVCGQVLPVIPQVVPNPTFIGISEPSQAPCTYIEPIIPPTVCSQVLPVIPQVVPNPTFIGIAEPCTYNAPITDTIIAPITPVTSGSCGVEENVLINSGDSITGVSEAFQQLLNDLIETKLNGYTTLSAIAETPDVQVNVIEPEVNIDLVPEVGYKSAITDQIETVTVLNDNLNSFSSINTNCSPISEGGVISKILIPSEIPVQLICDITEIQALQPSLTYEYQPVAFSFC